jgi:phosphatidate cytidylyltransferase
VALCALAWAAGWATLPPAVVWWIAAAVWVVGGLAVLRFGVAAWPRLPVALRLAVGLLLLCTAWLALVHAKTIGVNFILSTFCLVWAADIAAYFGGRALGRRKLAPAISPGKSWEGVWSGMAGALLVAVVWTLIEPSLVGAESKSLFATLAARLGLAGAALAIVVLVAMSVVGDLFESLVKRSAGAKDSSGLLPGHGGVLDRIDALLPALPIALALASL